MRKTIKLVNTGSQKSAAVVPLQTYSALAYQLVPEADTLYASAYRLPHNGGHRIRLKANSVRDYHCDAPRVVLQLMCYSQESCRVSALSKLDPQFVTGKSHSVDQRLVEVSMTCAMISAHPSAADALRAQDGEQAIKKQVCIAEDTHSRC